MDIDTRASIEAGVGITRTWSFCPGAAYTLCLQYGRDCHERGGARVHHGGCGIHHQDIGAGRLADVLLHTQVNRELGNVQS